MSELKDIVYPCQFDGTRQSAYCLPATGTAPRPLLVALHTWSCTYTAFNQNYEKFCRLFNWHLIHPDFRGENWRPQGCGSEAAVSDIVDAVTYMQQHYAVDAKRIYLAGGSGGGHATLLLAGRHPELWAAASAWCPISDVLAWHRQCLGTRFFRYAEHIVQACGGDPQESAAARQQAIARSPLTYLANANTLPLDISAGIHDGHSGSVPVSQSIAAYNCLAAPEDRIAEADCQYITEQEMIPAHLQAAGLSPDPSYGQSEVLFRRQSRNVRLTIFAGGHELLHWPLFSWLSRQERGRAADWRCGEAYQSGDVQSGGLSN
ncbi:MAG: prolyl oligopeptidase family serine peptidase [Lentisphaerae bacterium]|nr:prolyl oligopeptidase family serine peptidase [Lentisphaerota bacterium]